MQISTNIHLCEEANERYQLIYSSQNYGTFYSVYGKFEVKNNTLISIDFRLINFKGVLNLGIKNVTYMGFVVRYVKNPIDTPKEGLSEVTCAEFHMEIEALNTKRLYPFKFHKPIPISEFKNNYFCISRNLVNTGKKEGKDQIFDSEFFYRDGIRPAYEFGGDHLSYRQGKNVNKDKDKKDIDDGIPKDPGGICPRGYAKIIL